MGRNAALAKQEMLQDEERFGPQTTSHILAGHPGMTQNQPVWQPEKLLLQPAFPQCPLQCYNNDGTLAKFPPALDGLKKHEKITVSFGAAALAISIFNSKWFQKPVTKLWRLVFKKDPKDKEPTKDDKPTDDKPTEDKKTAEDNKSADNKKPAIDKKPDNDDNLVKDDKPAMDKIEKAADKIEKAMDKIAAQVTKVELDTEVCGVHRKHIERSLEESAQQHKDAIATVEKAMQEAQRIQHTSNTTFEMAMKDYNHVLERITRSEDNIKMILSGIQAQLDARDQCQVALEQMEACQRRTEATERRMEATERRMEATERRMEATERRLEYLVESIQGQQGNLAAFGDLPHL